MSMISAQCDELRQMADGQATFHDAREVMLEAADTIWELRCRLVDAEDRVRKSGELCKLCEREAENAKLRVERDEWHRVAVSKQDIIDHMRNANSENAKLREEVVELRKSSQTYDAENAKLRELVRIAVKHCDSGTCDGCPILGEDESCPYSDMARGLGVEVDE